MQLPQINFKKTALVLAIVVVFNLFVNYGIDTLYKKQPVWGRLLRRKKRLVSIPIKNHAKRLASDGTTTGNSANRCP